MMERVTKALRGQSGVAYNSRPRTDPTCAAPTHGTQSAYKKNRCRCPEAIAAHQAVLERRRGDQPPKFRVVEEPRDGCDSDKHDTQAAYAMGCRCPLALTRHERRLEVQREARRRKRVSPDPALAWRGPTTMVSRVNVLLLTAGFVDSPTTRERQLAIETLSRRGNRTGTGFLGTEEISARLGISEGVCRALRSEYRLLAGQRTQRRLADVQSKAQRVARALERENRD